MNFFEQLQPLQSTIVPTNSCIVRIAGRFQRGIRASVRDYSLRSAQRALAGARVGRVTGSAGNILIPPDLKEGVEKLNAAIAYASDKIDYASERRPASEGDRMKEDAELLLLLDACIVLSAVRQAAISRDWDKLSKAAYESSKDSFMHPSVFEEVALLLIQAHESISTRKLLGTCAIGSVSRDDAAPDAPISLSSISTGALASVLSNVRSSTRLAIVAQAKPPGELFSRRFLAVNECAAALVDLRRSALAGKWFEEPTPEDDSANVVDSSTKERAPKAVYTCLLYARRALDTLKRNTLAKISESSGSEEVPHTTDDMIQEAEAIISMEGEVEALSHERDVRSITRQLMSALLDGAGSGTPSKIDVSTIRTSTLRDAIKTAAAIDSGVPAYMRVCTDMARRTLSMREALNHRCRSGKISGSMPVTGMAKARYHFDTPRASGN